MPSDTRGSFTRFCSTSSCTRVCVCMCVCWHLVWLVASVAVSLQRWNRIKLSCFLLFHQLMRLSLYPLPCSLHESVSVLCCGLTPPIGPICSSCEGCEGVLLSLSRTHCVSSSLYLPSHAFLFISLVTVCLTYTTTVPLSLPSLSVLVTTGCCRAVGGGGGQGALRHVRWEEDVVNK